MADKKLIDEVGKYIDKYYEPVKDDIKMDKEMKSIFDKITKFRKKRAEEKAFAGRAGKRKQFVRRSITGKNLMFQRCRKQKYKKVCLLRCQ